MLSFMGLPLDLFGKDSFFQPYLPLQQIDMLSSPSYLCGSTNSIVTQHKDIDMLVNVSKICRITPLYGFCRQYLLKFHLIIW